MYSCEICEFFKNTYFEEHLQTTAFELQLFLKIPKSPKIVDGVSYLPAVSDEKFLRIRKFGPTNILGRR